LAQLRSAQKHPDQAKHMLHLAMPEEAIITAIEPGPDRTIDESLALEFLNVRFRIIRPSEYENKVVMVAFKDPPWLLELEPSAPLNGYVMQQGEFAASLVKDDRVAKGLKVSIEVSDVVPVK
jgi:hypothetical protein